MLHDKQFNVTLTYNIYKKGKEAEIRENAEIPLIDFTTIPDVPNRTAAPRATTIAEFLSAYNKAEKLYRKWKKGTGSLVISYSEWNREDRRFKSYRCLECCEGDKEIAFQDLLEIVETQQG